MDNFPSILFSGNSFEWVNQTHAVLKGDMTIKNVTRPVAFYIEVVDVDENSPGSDSVSMKATANIKRSDFEIFSLLPVVSDNVNLFISIDASKNGMGIKERSNVPIYSLNKAVSDTLELASIREEKQRKIKQKTSLRQRLNSGSCSGNSARFKSICR